MEKKESTTSSPIGMCEKLFNAFRPHRRVTLHHQGPEATTSPSPTQPNHSLDSGIKDAVKPRAPARDQKKPSEDHAPKAQPKPTASPPRTSVPVQKVPHKLVLTSAPPKAAATPQPVPQPAPPEGEAEAESSKKNINEKAEDYIKRAKRRIRSISGIGRTPTSK